MHTSWFTPKSLMELLRLDRQSFFICVTQISRLQKTQPEIIIDGVKFWEKGIQGIAFRMWIVVWGSLGSGPKPVGAPKSTLEGTLLLWQLVDKNQGQRRKSLQSAVYAGTPTVFFIKDYSLWSRHISIH